MLILGISDTIDAGAALVQDGRILAAVNEERLSRRKFHTGFPARSIPEVLRIAEVRPEEVQMCSYAGRTLSLCTDPDEESFERRNPSKRLASLLARTGLLRPLLGSEIGLSAYRAALNPPFRLKLRRVSKHLHDAGFRAGLETVDHHSAHAAAAACTNGWQDCLICTLDASGDGYCALIAQKRNGRICESQRVGAFHSLGVFYLYVTLLLGFRPGREGKVTGMAAYGDPAGTIEVFRQHCRFSEKTGCFRNDALGYACDYGALKRDLRGFKKEDIAAGIQRHFEDSITRWVAHHVRKSGLPRVALSGGVFANVRVNQCLRERPEIEDIYVFPHMGDGGGAVGAAMHTCQQRAGDAFREAAFDNVYFGPSFGNDEIRSAIGSFPNLRCRPCDDPEAELACAIADGKIVGRFSGRMEYGPRALGNRSILYRGTDATVREWLNNRLGRSKHMPFAPAILEEHAAECLKGWRSDQRAAWFMTTAYDALPAFRRAAPGVVHVDGTTRPQVLRRSSNPDYHRLLSEYHRLTGLPFVLNTSFNLHEEPIVCTPEDALRAFQHAELDMLSLEQMIVEPAGRPANEV